LKPHEAEAITQLILVALAMAKLLDRDDNYAAKLRGWSRIAEEFIERSASETLADC